MNLSKKKKAVTLICILLASLSIIVFYKNWTKPYKLPEIDNSLTLLDYNLDFDVEKNTALLSPTLTIDEIKSLVLKNPNNLVYSTELRLRLNKINQTNEYINFMKEEVEQTPRVRIQIALAFVDMLQDLDLGTAALGQRSSESINILNGILKENPYDIPARYARGLNNLYWPQGLQRSEQAIQDLAYCIAVQQALNDTEFSFWPAIYAALGDAWVKNGNIKKGISIWKQASYIFPKDNDLQKRANADENQAYEIVKEERGINGFQRPNPKISDISIIWGG
ncbi:MAG: tetratricopeptide repeat protein [Bacillota bacterium]